MVTGSSAMALPAPPKPLASLDPGWRPITLRVDVRNLTGPEHAGRIEEARLARRLEEVNRVWSQCAVSFVPRSVTNVSAPNLGIPYEPRSQEDLSRIAAALNPSGFPALPLTVAGPWGFEEKDGFRLSGLGWVFTSPRGIERIGAMISSTKFHDVSAAPIIAHELAHALSLPHVAEPGNLMGPGGTNELTPGQCLQARRFSEVTLGELLAKAE
ncbi:MAG: hypothetical protein NDJ89_13595 [Oligoflexia bacterium]|nr:hypothetical protein [Oligoflexia bacterium]